MLRNFTPHLVYRTNGLIYYNLELEVEPEPEPPVYSAPAPQYYPFLIPLVPYFKQPPITRTPSFLHFSTLNSFNLPPTQPPSPPFSTINKVNLCYFIKILSCRSCLASVFFLLKFILLLFGLGRRFLAPSPPEFLYTFIRVGHAPNCGLSANASAPHLRLSK